MPEDIEKLYEEVAGELYVSSAYSGTIMQLTENDALAAEINFNNVASISNLSSTDGYIKILDAIFSNSEEKTSNMFTSQDDKTVNVFASKEDKTVGIFDNKFARVNWAKNTVKSGTDPVAYDKTYTGIQSVSISMEGVYAEESYTTPVGLLYSLSIGSDEYNLYFEDVKEENKK